MYFNNIIAAGCSFTQDGIGGMPPGHDHPGSNSFLDYPEDGIRAATPRSWASIVAQTLRVKSFVNVAASSHGNIVSANCILDLLEHFPYNTTDTLVLFNVTEPIRLDLPCEFDNVNRSKHIPWDQSLIPHSYLSRSSEVLRKAEQQMGMDSISYLSTNSVSFLMHYLKNQDYKFAFLTMSNYSNDRYLSPMLGRYQDYFVRCGAQIGMKEFCVDHRITISADDFHPNIEGHRQIAKKILDFLHPSSSSV